MPKYGKNLSYNIDEEEIVEEHKNILDKRNLINSSEVEILMKYSMKHKNTEIYQEDNPKIMMERNFAFGNHIQNSDTDAQLRGSSMGFQVSTSTSDNQRKYDNEEAYANPNKRNDLSQMNISHLSQDS
jgi:hypothetical protein